MDRACLIIAASEKNADLYYATRFLAPDPFIFAEINGRRIIAISDLEIDRAKSQAKVDEVLSFKTLQKAVSRRGMNEPTTADVADELLKGYSVTKVEVPSDFSLLHADGLRKHGYTLEPKSDPFFPERLIKSKEEIAFLTQTLRSTEEALRLAIELIHRASVAADGALQLEGSPLTAERLRRAIHMALLEMDCTAWHTIVACGVQAVDPHNEGFGLLRANEPIVIDVFPKHAATLYFADITRTVVKGRASEKVVRMFNAVKEGQAIAFRMIKDGVDGSSVHNAILDFFEKQGFKTGEQNGRLQGFFHGTGHGVGLEIHEPPRINPKPDALKEGMVVTVEPGLYYLDGGGVRIEDMVVVTKDGCRVLTEAPKVLEV